MERELRARDRAEVADEELLETTPAPADTRFTAQGPIPPVATDAVPRAPTASELAFGSEHKQTAPEAGTTTPRPAPAPAIDRAPTHPDRQRTAGFEQIARSHIHEGAAPSEVKLPGSLVHALDQAWADSQSKPEREQGGNIVRTSGGAYHLRRGKDHDGSTYHPDPHDVGWTETKVGVAHTHPYQDEGYEYGTFSGVDLGNMVNEDEPLKMLRSGPYTFMIARTTEFDALVKNAEDRGEEFGLSKRISQTFDRAYDAHTGKFAEKLEAGVLAVCREFHLVYYEGRGADLHRASGAPPK